MSPDDIRTEARDWYETHWSPDLTVGDWWETLGRSGWGYPGWPVEHAGRGLGRAEVRIVREERRRVGALGPPSGIGPSLMVPILLQHGTDEQLARYVPELAWGGATMCQMLSEPDAGSDLAGVTTTAERDGDEWVLTGSKIWTSRANEVDYGMLLARTDWDVPKHQGLTFFLIRRDQPGVEVRPLRTMTGGASFNQVFFDRARVAAADLVGSPGGGWAVTRTFLVLEKNSYNPASHEGGPFGKVDLGLTCGELQERQKASSAAAIQGRGVGRMVTDLAKRSGRSGDPLVRQSLANLHGLRRAVGALQGPGSKLAVSNLTRAQRDVGLGLAGADGMLVGDDAPLPAFATFAIGTPALSIAGGTDEIQRNAIGDKTLGLPPEPKPDPNLSFRDERR